MKRERVHGFCDDVLADHDAVALAELVRTRQVRPSELAEAAIARARAVDPRLHAIAVERYDRAVQEADRGRDGFFAGVPTFLKDNTDLAGLQTGFGSAAVEPQTARRDGAYAQQFLAQGFVCLGKTRLSEFGLNATNEPPGGEPTRNPWDLDYSSGASSSGSAALVAAGVVPLAHANDGGGSIRIPAACCGLVGLKPTRGRHVVSELAKTMPVNLIGEGVVTRSVRDTAYFHAEAERYFRNRELPAIGTVEGPGRRRLRIGMTVDSVIDGVGDPQTREAVEQTAALLTELGHEVERVEIPFTAQFADDFLLYWSALAFFIAAGGRWAFPGPFDPARLDGLTKGLARSFKRGFYRLPVALRRLARSRERYAELFSTRDAFLTPVVGHTTPRLGYLSPTVEFEALLDRLTRYASFTPLANASGGPAISLPVAQTPAGLPVGVQLFANHGDERTLLELAYEIEAARPWRRIHRGDEGAGRDQEPTSV